MLGEVTMAGGGVKVITETRENYRFVSGYERTLRERADAVQTRGECFFCGESFTGTSAEVREWHRTHREAVHPKARDRGVAARMAAAKKAPHIGGYTGRGKGTEK